MRWMTGSQWRSNKIGVMWSRFFLESNKAGRWVLDSLKFAKILIGEVDEETITIVKARRYESMNEFFTRLSIKIFSDTADLLQSKWGRTSDVVNMRSHCHHGHVSVQNNTEVTSIRNKIDNCFSCSDVGDGRVLSKTRSEMQNLGFTIVENKKVSGHPSFDVRYALFNSLNCNRSLWWLHRNI